MHTLYTATGCTRCKLVMRKMDELAIPYQEHDIKAAGKDIFQQFYTANRRAIYRGPEGIEFPILNDEDSIHQGLGPALAWVQAGSKLDGFFRIGRLHKEWLDGIIVSGGNPDMANDFLGLLRYLKQNAMKLELQTSGKNADILAVIIKENLADRIIMTVLGPLDLYSNIAGTAISEAEIKKTISLVAQFPERQFQTEVVPVRRQDGTLTYLTPDEIGEAAALIEQASGSKQQPYFLRPFHPVCPTDPAVQALEPMNSGMLFPYRSKAREFQVKTEIEREA